MQTITRERIEELEAVGSTDRTEFNRLLEQYTGIIAKSHIAYTYYDESDNFVGDSEECDVYALLDNAYIEIAD